MKARPNARELRRAGSRIGEAGQAPRGIVAVLKLASERAGNLGDVSGLSCEFLFILI